MRFHNSFFLFREGVWSIGIGYWGEQREQRTAQGQGTLASSMCTSELADLVLTSYFECIALYRDRKYSSTQPRDILYTMLIVITYRICTTTREIDAENDSF